MTPPDERPPLYQHAWTGVRGDAIGTLVVVHGLSEHGGRYAAFASAANREGFAVAAADLYGHGRSPGARGHIRDFDADHLAAVDEAIRRIEKETPEMPLILVGHSLGGLIAARWAQARVFAHRLRGLVLISPYVAERVRVPVWKRAAAAVLGRLAPAVSLPTGIADEDVFRDPEAATAYAADPLVQRRMSAGHWSAIRTELELLTERAPALRTPTLFLVAGDDRVVATPATLELAAMVHDATVIEYPEAFHNLQHDPVGPQMFADLLAWSKARIED